MKIKINRYLKTALKIILSVGALYFVFTKIDIHSVLSLYKQSKIPYIIIAILLFTFSKTIAAYRLNNFFKCIGIVLPQITNIKLYLLGMFYNLFLPGGIGGDGYKIYLLNKNHEVKGRRIFWAILLDRLNGMLALFCLAILLMVILPPVSFSFDYRFVLWILIPFAIFIFYIIIRSYYTHFIPFLGKITLQSFLVQITQAICAYVILLAIGNNEYFLQYLLLFLISSIVATLPITIGGVGSREITFLFGSSLLGLNADISIALSLMFYLITLFVSFFGIIYSINTSGIKLKN